MNKWREYSKGELYFDVQPRVQASMPVSDGVVQKVRLTPSSLKSHKVQDGVESLYLQDISETAASSHVISVTSGVFMRSRGMGFLITNF